MFITIQYQDTEERKLLEKKLERAIDTSPDLLRQVHNILEDVRQRGDQALVEYAKQFDNVTIDPDNLKVTEEEWGKSLEKVDADLLDTMERAAERIRAFHEKQRRQSFFDAADGAILGQMYRPLNRAGVYVPGGKAAYPSSVLMNVIPARVAGVSEIIMATPSKKDGIVPTVLAAAKIAGVDAIYKIGGAQAIGAMAYGTETVPKVDKIVGPGNIYVAMAKRSVFGHVSVDSVAGPSEILVIADDTANPSFVAADLLSQAEHDEMAQAILITPSAELAFKVSEQIRKQLEELPRKEIAQKSLDRYGCIVLVSDLLEAVSLSNQIAPEHLELCVEHPFDLLTYVQNAGAVFLGHYAPEPLGDYMAGCNHVLPTEGTARFFSALSVDDFIKKTSVMSFSKGALSGLHRDIERFAKAEGFDAHARAVAIRFKEDQQ